MFYLVKSSWFIRKMYPGCTWAIDPKDKTIFLTFDDGPHPEYTPFVLEQLKNYDAKATFFCLGKNVLAYPDIYLQMIEGGHAAGNHSFSHLNGWKVKDKIYLDDIAEAKKYIDSNLYRPPYGRIKSFQLRQLALPRFQLKTIMWTVLSGDFDKGITKENCLQNVILNAEAGSIVLFHDSEKAFERMKYALTGTLKYFSDKGFSFKKITADML